MAVFANGVCEYDGDVRDREDPPYGFIVEYASECNVQESDAFPTFGVLEYRGEERLAGNCDLDVDECDSSPCQNGATCSESSVEASVSFHAYQCTCVAGFANGVCEYQYVYVFESLCSVVESTYNVADPSVTGNCDVDVNELSLIHI